MSSPSIRKLQDIVTFEKGKPPAQQAYFGLDAELYLTPEYLRGKGTLESIKPSINAVRIIDGDTIVLWDGSNAGEVFRGRKGILSSTMTRLKYGDHFDGNYFYYAVKRWESYLKGQTSGSGIPHVDKEILGKLEIIDFTYPEQSKIAETLTTMDTAIEQTEALITKQQLIKTGLMQDLLTLGIDEHGNIRSEATHQFKDSPLGRIPVEWEAKTIKEMINAQLITDIQDGNHGEIHPKSKDFVDEGIPFIMASDISEGFVNTQRAKKISVEQYNRLRIGFSKPYDILLSHKASIGFVALVPPELSEIMLTPQVTYYRIGNVQKLIPIFLKHFFCSPKFQDQLKSLAKQSTRDYIGILAQQKLVAIYPRELREQHIICNCLNLQDLKTLDLEQKLRKLLALKIALMQDLLTGKKRITPLLQQPQQ